MLPMYQSEAMWIKFNSDYIHGHNTAYPFAVKVATGKIDAVTGKTWTNGLHGKQQDYIVAPKQPWLDGYCVEKGIIRQFVAMPLGSGYSAEEQITKKAEHGGIQIIVYPMKRTVFERRFQLKPHFQGVRFSTRKRSVDNLKALFCAESSMEMGLAPGGRMKQKIYDDPYGINDWESGHSGRCFIHIANSLVWHASTGVNPPTPPPTSKEYANAGLPWFEYYSDASALEGSNILKGVKSEHHEFEQDMIDTVVQMFTRELLSQWVPDSMFQDFRLPQGPDRESR